MKKIFLLIIIIVLITVFFPIKPYIECNHLSIITKIEVNCSSVYDITYYETIPIRDDNGIKYNYKKYNIKNSNLILGIKQLENNKNIYKDKARYVIKCNNKKEIINIIKET